MQSPPVIQTIRWVILTILRVGGSAVAAKVDAIGVDVRQFPELPATSRPRRAKADQNPTW